jgi:hypothetical protein
MSCARIGRTSFPTRVRLLGGELVIDVRRDSMTMRGPAEYMRPFALEWPDRKAFSTLSLDDGVIPTPAGIPLRAR